ncbi:MAG: NAD(P)/FAD-dependent oxidoreductase [Solirubrobacterales bacterium]|nr:NAD(P)/FAD-dependent oxidoreductase [Solirubrobacterales bacterium]
MGEDRVAEGHPGGEFEVIVIGAGPAGEVAAGRLAERGKRVAIIERHLVGGECSFYACMPSKALLRPAEALEEVRRVPGAAEAATGSLEVQAVLARRDEIIHNLNDESQLPWLGDRGIVLLRGDARLDGERRVRVAGQLLHAAEAVVIAVGSGPLFPPIPGLADAHAWSNREITTASAVPRSLAVLGGGVTGVEMAQAWRWLGARVTVVEALDRLIAREEPLAARELQEAMARDGIDVRLGSRASDVRREDGMITISLESGDEVAAERLLVAIGRRPLTAGLGLETVGLEPGGPLEVDDHLRVPEHPWLYGIGDITARSLLTHSGKYEARIAADNILGLDALARTDGPGAPRVTFTRPQVAAVGTTLAGALDAGRRADAIDIATSSTAGASFVGREAPGTTRFVVDLDREVLLGVTFIGAEVADFLQAATIAVVGQVPLAQLAHAVAAFPTRSELWLNFIEAYESKHKVSLHEVRSRAPHPV